MRAATMAPTPRPYPPPPLRDVKRGGGMMVTTACASTTSAPPPPLRDVCACFLIAPQLEALYFAGRGFGEFGQELDPARIFERREPLFDEDFEFVRQGIRWFVALFEYHICPGLNQFVGVEVAYYGCFEYGRVSDERSLYLDGGNPLTTDFEHVIGPATVPVVAVRVLIIFVAGMNPVTVDHVFGL